MESLRDRFERLLETETDIQEHMRDLFRLALECRRITEFGVRGGISTTALFYGLFMARHASSSCSLVCYDVQACPVKEYFAKLGNRPGWPGYEFHQQSSLETDIPKTDLLFIDSLHTYKQLKEELLRHGGSVKTWIVLHDTVTFGKHGEDGGPGLLKAVEEFLDQGTFQVEEDHKNQNGLMVLARRDKGK